MPQLEERRVDDLLADPLNVKIHTEEQIKHLVESIRAFGFRDPIGIDDNGVIIEGHGRLAAAKMLGMETVPVIVVSGLSEAERRAYGIAHNIANANTGLDMQGVLSEFDHLSVGADEMFSIGFTESQLMAYEPFDGWEAPARSDAPPKSKMNRTSTKTKIAFERIEHERQWTAWMAELIEKYKDARSDAERIARYVAEQSGGGGHGC